MGYKVLYRKYRPDDFSSIIGQKYMVSILKNSIAQNKISHAYLFSGPRGTGKTSTAKVFAKAINCLNPTENGPCNNCDSCKSFKENADIIEIDAASNNGVDEIREIINNIKLAPAYSKYKVYIIDEVHMLSTSAFNALLLTLEEPPKHVVFILATTNVEAVPITILSRCQRFDFHKISTEDIIDRLNYVIESEKIEIEKEALEEVAYISDGGLRDALSILDQLSSSNTKITMTDVIAHFGAISKKQINDFYNTIVSGDMENFVELIKKFKSLAIDYKQFIKKFLEKIEEQAILSKKEKDYQGIAYQDLKNMAYDLASISNYVNINIEPYLLIEITLINYIKNEENNPQIISREIKSEIINNISQENTIISQELTGQSEKIISREIKLEQTTNKEIENLVKIRINNCFTSAKKEYLENVRIAWTEFIKKVSDKTILNLLIDSVISAASDKIAIITNNSNATVNLINENLLNISNLFKTITNLDYKFIALSDTKWNEEKKIYINNLKNKIKYTYQEEPSEDQAKVENTNDDFESALNIFDKNKIIIE